MARALPRSEASKVGRARAERAARRGPKLTSEARRRAGTQAVPAVAVTATVPRNSHCRLSRPRAGGPFQKKIPSTLLVMQSRDGVMQPREY